MHGRQDVCERARIRLYDCVCAGFRTKPIFNHSCVSFILPVSLVGLARNFRLNDIEKFRIFFLQKPNEF